MSYKKIILGFGSLVILMLASALTTGAVTVCPITSGCTGTSTTPTRGQILIGNDNGNGTYVFIASSSLSGGGGGSGSISTSSQLVNGQPVFASGYNTVYSTSSYPVFAQQVTVSGTLMYVSTSTLGGLVLGIPSNVGAFTNDKGYVSTNTSTSWVDGQLLFGTVGNNATTSALFTVSTSTGLLTVSSSSLTNISSTRLDLIGKETVTYGYPILSISNTNGSQYAGAELCMTNAFASLGGQAGANFYAGINDGATTQGYFAMDITDKNCSGKGHLLLFTGTSSLEVYTPLLVNGTNVQLTQDPSGYLNFQEVAGGGNGLQSILQVLSPTSTPQESTLSLTRIASSSASNAEFTDLTDENYNATDNTQLKGGSDHAVSINVSNKGTGTARPFVVRWWNSDNGSIATNSYTGLELIPDTNGSSTQPRGIFLGIGTSTPSSTLTVVGASSTPILSLYTASSGLAFSIDKKGIASTTELRTPSSTITNLTIGTLNGGLYAVGGLVAATSTVIPNSATSPITLSSGGLIACSACIVSSTGWIDGQIFFGMANGNVTSSLSLTFATSTGIFTVGSSSLANVSGTNETLSGYLQVQNLFDKGGNKYSTSTGGGTGGVQTSTATGYVPANNQIAFFYPNSNTLSGSSTVTITTTTAPETWLSVFGLVSSTELTTPSGTIPTLQVTQLNFSGSGNANLTNSTLDLANGPSNVLIADNGGSGSALVIQGASNNSAGSDIIFKMGTSNTDRLHILNNGKIGINTATPGGQLDVLGLTSSTQLQTSNSISSTPALSVIGNPLASSTLSLVQIGQLIGSGNASGTWLTINAPTSTTGLDFLNFQVASATKFSINDKGVASSTEVRTPSSTITNLTIGSLNGGLYSVAGLVAATSTVIPNVATSPITLSAGGTIACQSCIVSSTGWVDGQLFFGTATNYVTSSALFAVSTSTGVFTAGSSSLANVSGTNETLTGYFTAATTSTFSGALTISTTTALSNALLTIATSSPIFVVSKDGGVAIGTSTSKDNGYLSSNQAYPLLVEANAVNKDVIQLDDSQYNGQSNSGIQFNHANSNGSGVPYGAILNFSNSTTPGAEQGWTRFFNVDAGSMGEKLTIKGSNVGVSQTNPGTTFDVNGATTLETTLVLATTTASAGTALLTIATSSPALIVSTSGGLSLNTSTVALAGQFIDQGIGAGAGNGSACMSTARVLLYDAGANCIISSARFKHDIKDFTTGLSEIVQLKPVAFYYNKGVGWPGQQIGLVAEQANTVDPRLVQLDSNNKPLSVRYENVTAMLVNAVQDLWKQMQSLLARVSGLENRMNAQDKKIQSLEQRLNTLEAKK